MKIYIVIIEDRHFDVDALPFSTAEKAIEYAKQYALDNATSVDDVKESEVESFLYYALYSCEDDSVSVIERNLDVE